MDWLLGRKQNPNFSQFVPPKEDLLSINEEEKSKEMQSYRFDSGALERAAKAAKDLEQSKHSKELLDAVMKQEETKKAELETRTAQFQFEQSKINAEAKEREHQFQKEVMKEQARRNQEKAQYEDQLARKRYQDQIEQQARATEENQRKIEESLQRQESMRRATREHEREQETKLQTAKIQAEYNARAQSERENWEITKEKIKLEKREEGKNLLAKLREERETKLQSLKTLSTAIGSGWNQFMSNEKQVATFIAGTITIIGGFYIAKRGTRVAFNYLESVLTQPQLVSNTSRIMALEAVKHPIKTFGKIRKKVRDPLEGIVLHPQVEEDVRDLALATKHTKINYGYFRNTILYGPPGTGKTLCAEALAKYSGMDYAIVSGGDFSVPKGDIVLQIQKLFRWADSSRKGLILFVDEADAFLRKRSTDMTKDQRDALSAFLQLTGTQSHKFQLIIATNTQEDLDFAITNRIHDSIAFPLPTYDERLKILLLYVNKYIAIPSQSGSTRLKIDKNLPVQDLLKQVAKMSEGFSGRDLAYLVSDWKAATYASESGTFTKELILKKAAKAVKNKHIKSSWLDSREKEREKILPGGMNLDIASMDSKNSQNNPELSK